MPALGVHAALTDSCAVTLQIMHADRTDNWASKSQPTAKTGITQAKIREDGKERQGDSDIALHLFSLSISLSRFPRLFSSVLQREPSRMAAGASPVAGSHSEWAKGQAHSSQMAFSPWTLLVLPVPEVMTAGGKNRPVVQNRDFHDVQP